MQRGKCWERESICEAVTEVPGRAVSESAVEVYSGAVKPLER